MESSSGVDLQDRRRRLDEYVANSVTNKFDRVPLITAKDAAGLDDVLMVDVRADEEFLVSAIPSAVHWRKFESMLSNGEVVQRNICFYCSVGARSGKYATRLLNRSSNPLQGKSIYNMSGSILQWTHDPECPDLRKPDSIDSPAEGPVADAVHCFGERWNLGHPRYRAVTFSLLQQGIEVAKWVGS
jgi:rhodanese-related sulfurtransferase